MAALSERAASRPALAAEWMLMLHLGAEAPARAINAAKAMKQSSLGEPTHLQRLLLHAVMADPWPTTGQDA